MGFGYWLTGFCMGVVGWWLFWGRRPMLAVALVVGLWSSAAFAQGADEAVGPSITASQPTCVITVAPGLCQSNQVGQLVSEDGQVNSLGKSWSSGATNWGTAFVTFVQFPLFDYGEYYYGQALVGGDWWQDSAGFPYRPRSQAYVSVTWDKGANYLTLSRAKTFGDWGTSNSWVVYQNNYVSGAVPTNQWVYQFAMEAPDGTVVNSAVSSAFELDHKLGVSGSLPGYVLLWNVVAPPTTTQPTTNPSTQPSTQPSDSEVPKPSTQPWAGQVADSVAGDGLRASVFQQSEASTPTFAGLGSRGGLPDTIAHGEATNDASIAADFVTVAQGFGAWGTPSFGSGDTATGLAAFYGAVVDPVVVVGKYVDGWLSFKSQHSLLLYVVQTVSTGLICWAGFVAFIRMAWFAWDPKSSRGADMLELE